MARRHIGSALAFCVAFGAGHLAGHAAPQLEAGVGVGSAVELGGRRAATAPGYLAPRVAVLSEGPAPGGSIGYFGAVSVPLSIDGEAIGVQPTLGVQWRPSVDFAYGLAASVIIGIEPVTFGIVEGAAEARYYLTVGTALFAQVAIDYVLAREDRYLLGGLVGLTVALDLAGATS